MTALFFLFLMNKKWSAILLLSLFLSSVCFNHSATWALENDPVFLILDSAEQFFISLRDHDYPGAWNLITEKSRNVIIDDVQKASRRMGMDIERSDIAADFQNHGELFYNYWHSFTSSFDPDLIIEKSRWEMGDLNKHEAEIIITYRKSENPARLQMFRDAGSWKVGLVETFWTRKKMSFLNYLFQ